MGLGAVDAELLHPVAMHGDLCCLPFTKFLFHNSSWKIEGEETRQLQLTCTQPSLCRATDPPVILSPGSSTAQ